MSEEETQDPVVEASKPEEVEALKAEKARLEQELEKLKNKDHNFEALRRKQLAEIELTPEEKQQLLGAELKELKDKQENFVKTQYERTVATYLRQFSSETDEEGRKKIMLQYERLAKSDNPQDDDQIFATMRDAARIAGVGNTPFVDPIVAAASYYRGGTPTSKKKSFVDSDDGKNFAKSVGFDVEQYEKLKKEGKI